VAENILDVEPREATGKGVARKLRAAGRIPGICYGQANTRPISVDPVALDRLIHRSASGMNTLIDLRVAGGGEFDGKKVLLKEMQRDPVTNAPLHADFFALDLAHDIDVSIPIHVRGSAPGVTLKGGILDQVLREIEIECRPDAIPDEVQADVSELDLGMSLHVRDLILPPGVKLLTDPDRSVVSGVAPTAVEEAAPVAEGAEEAVEAAEEAAPQEAEEESEKGD